MTNKSNDMFTIKNKNGLVKLNCVSLHINVEVLIEIYKIWQKKEHLIWSIGLEHGHLFDIIARESQLIQKEALK